jgi:hypothetical protein
VLAVYSSTLLASPNLATGRVGPSGISLNGETIFDDAAFFRADFATLFGRGRGPRTFEFTVLAIFSSESDAITFAATHEDGLPVQADLVLTDDADTLSLRMADAISQASIGRIIGVSVEVHYRFTGARFIQESPADIPDPTTDSMKVGQQNISAADESAVVTFPAAFGAAPTYVNLIVEEPVAAAPVSVVGLENVTAAGFTAKFSAAVPGSGYKARWQAIL